MADTRFSNTYKTSDCGETITENHSWDEGSITTEPTIDSESIKPLPAHSGTVIHKHSNLFSIPEKQKVRKKLFFEKVPKQVKPAMPILSLLCAPLPLCFCFLVVIKNLIKNKIKTKSHSFQWEQLFILCKLVL